MIIGLLLLIGFGAAIDRMVQHTMADFRSSKAKAVKAREKATGKSPLPGSDKRAVHRRHVRGYWGREVAGGFPVIRTGFHSGWLAHQGAAAQAKGRREEERVKALRKRHAFLTAAAKYRADREQLEQEIAAVVAENPPERPTLAGVRERAGAKILQFRPRDDTPAEAHESALAGTCSHGGHGWDGETCSDIDDASRAEWVKTCGHPGCVMTVPHTHGVSGDLPEPGPYAPKDPDMSPAFAAMVEQNPEAMNIEAFRRLKALRDSGYEGPVDQDGNPAEVGSDAASWSAADCTLCGDPLGLRAHDGWNHNDCENVNAADDQAHELHDRRPLEEVEEDLRGQDRCSHQLNPGGWDGDATYCGQDVIDTEDEPGPGEPPHRPVLYCPEHQAEHDGDEEGAAEERQARTQALLEQRYASPSTEGTASMSEMGYRAHVAAAQAHAAQSEQGAADFRAMARTVEQQADDMQGSEMDSATMAEILDLREKYLAAAAAADACNEGSVQFGQNLQTRHEGLAEAHENAPVEAAHKDFYQNA